MNSLIARLKTAAQKRSAYNRTVHEIATMPQDVAHDLGIYPGDARRIAYQAVYGR